MGEKRQDNKRIVLKQGETQRKNGTYDFRWLGSDGKRHSVYAKTLKELREKEKVVSKDRLEGIEAFGMYKTVNDMYDLWVELKKGLKDNTFNNYMYMYRTYVQPTKFGKMRVGNVKKSDVKAFYNMLYDERCLKTSTIDSIHTVLHQVLAIAVDDNYLRNNPSDNALKELKQAHNGDIEKRKALTIQEEMLFLNFIKYHPQYSHWYPIFLIMLRTGLRVGEITGLRWQDIDLEKGIIYVNHTLVYYAHLLKNGCYFGINTTKTPASKRIVVMSEEVKDAFIQEKHNQEELGVKCSVTIDGYTDFIFINRFGEAQHNGTLNKALTRIIRDCNDAQLIKDEETPLLLPHFSCHNLRHTYTTRLCEAGVNIKVIQDMLGHSDISTTLNIYADVTREMRTESMETMQAYYSEHK